MSGEIFAFLALAPALLGPLPAPPIAISARLCTGTGSLATDVRLPQKRTPLTAPCHAKGCHIRTRRGKFDLPQGR